MKYTSALKEFRVLTLTIESKKKTRTRSYESLIQKGTIVWRIGLLTKIGVNWTKLGRDGLEEKQSSTGGIITACLYIW